VSTHLLDHLPNKSVARSTQHDRFNKDDNTKYIFRASPKFRKESTWYDWAMIDWGLGVGKAVPTRLLCFLDLTNLPQDFNRDTSRYSINETGKYAVVARFAEVATETWTWPSSAIDQSTVNNILLHGTLDTDDPD
jgi:hypothetical protein